MYSLLHVARVTVYAAAVVLSCSAATAAPVAGVLDRAATKIERLQKRVYLAVSNAGNRIVAVGERGLIAISDDAGKSWFQANCPISVTLTGVTFSTPQQGWAIGHAGVVLHTDDSGLNWSVQLDGPRAAKIVEASAKEIGGGAGSTLMRAATQLVADGPDKPFLDIRFTDSQRGLIVGAYGLILRTDDGGKTWKSMMHQLPNPKGLHLYAVRVVGDAIWVAGEQGFLALSRDAGKSFSRIETPYRGSYFTMVPTSDGVVIGGLRGNAFHVDRNGFTFQRVDGTPPVSISASTTLQNGSLVFANQSGQLMISTDGGKRMDLLPITPPGPLSALLQTADGSIIVAGLNGLNRITLQATNALIAGIRK